LEAAFLQGIKIASYSSRVSHARLDAANSEKYRYIMRDSIKPFPHLAFSHSKGPKTRSKLPSFDGELMASFPDLARSMSVIGILRQLPVRSVIKEGPKPVG